MDTFRFLRVKELFRSASALDGERREALLTRECGDDAELRIEVLDLLAHAASASTDFLEGGVRSPAIAQPHPAFEIPGFRIVKMIAAGGAGVVYRAQQLAPAREVAIKVLRLDTLGPGQVARFRREAEILAALSHPGIAQVYGAGVIESGSLALPWIAMELVQGITLDEYVADRRSDTHALLELFREVCAAVDHAHERGIVHRDLKPSNVLVGSDGHPRILDFGVARILGETGGATAHHTRTGSLVGTLAYMAPEQARGERDPIDTRADVYALGVMLHEALVGRPPLVVDGLDVIEAVRVVCTIEPERLSRARPDLPADLDAIVSKALEKEPGRRYTRAGDLAADIENLLAHRPVRARRPTTLDQARKFVRRNRAVTIATSFVFVSLAVALATALVALDNQSRQRAITSETLDFLASRMAALSPQLGFGESQREDLEKVGARIERQLASDPRSRGLRAAAAQTLYELASLDQARSDYDAMRPRLEAARAIRVALTDEDPGDTESWTHLSEISAKLGEAARDTGDLAQRDVWFARALAIDERLAREHPDEPEFVEDLGWSLARVVGTARQRGDHAEAERLSLRRLEDARRLVERDPENWKFLFNLSDAHHVLGGVEVSPTPAALEHAVEAVRLARRLRQIDPVRRDFVAWSANTSRAASSRLQIAGRLVEARAYAEEALNAAEELALADPRRPAHLDLVQMVANWFASPELGDGRRERAKRSTISLRRVAEVATRAGETSGAESLSAQAEAIEATAARDSAPEPGK
ncbi:MAG: serine/threonine-protein kinase [Planctomycetota bacterium]|nr:serine/threonine-protein kinase [Planctomycetota bacterium]